jgi:CSLREA domain-containing protein
MQRAEPQPKLGGLARRIRWFAGLTGSVLMVCATPVAYASTIRVTTTADVVAGDGACSLREAVLAANSDTPVGGCVAGAGADVIRIPSGVYPLALAGADDTGVLGDLDVTSDVRLVARSGAAIDANHLDRVLDVHAPAVVVVDGLTLANGLSADGGFGLGGGVRSDGDLRLVGVTIQDSMAGGPGGGAGGGVYSTGTLTLVNSLVWNNAGYGAEGAGIWSSGSARIVHSTILSNATSPPPHIGHDVPPQPAGGGIVSAGPLVLLDSNILNNGGGSGGGIEIASTATIERTTVAGNAGGGIENSGVTTLRQSTVRDNTASGFGGGLRNHGTLTVERSSVYGNEVTTSRGTDGPCGCADGVPDAFGGGIDNEAALSVINSSVFFNRAVVCDDDGCESAQGGGIANHTAEGASAPASLLIVASTIAGNTVNGRPDGGQIGPVSGGGIANVSGVVVVRGSLVADNAAIRSSSVYVLNDCTGALDTPSRSLLGVTRGCRLSSGGDNLLGVDPLLTYSSGSFAAVTLQPGSPAIDAGATSPGPACPRVDQRGVARPQDGNGDGIALCDIGATEQVPG